MKASGLNRQGFKVALCIAALTVRLVRSLQRQAGEHEEIIKLIGESSYAPPAPLRRRPGIREHRRGSIV